MENEVIVGYNEASKLFWDDKLDESLQVCLKLLKHFPSNAAILNLAGSSLYKKKMLNEAESLLSMAHEISPEIEEITLNLARVLRDLNKAGQAIVVLEETLDHKPSSPRVLSALGEIHYFNKQFDLAAARFKKVVRLTPQDVDALFKLACSLQEIDKTEEAYSLYKQILEINHSHAETYVNLGQIYKSLGDHETSIKLFRRSAELKPDDPSYASRALFCSNYVSVSGEQLNNEASQWAERFANPLTPKKKAHTTREPSRPIKLGFISADFSMHPVGKLLLPVIKKLDTSLFDIHCFSNVQIEDEMTRRYRETVHNFHTIRNIDDKSASEMIQKAGIDILIDLSGHTNFNRLGVLARKPAPYQIMWLGYFNTTGMKAMDYVLADSVNIPPTHDKYYSEKVLRLADTFFPFALPEKPFIPKNKKTNQTTFGCFNDAGKITDKVLETWSTILKEVKDSRLILKSKTFSDQWVRNRFIERSIRYGISPHRLIFLGPSTYREYIEAYSMVDIALDPFPYSGGATTADALFTNTPVITCPLDSFASRLSASILTACDMDQLVCHGLDDYISKAITLGSDATYLDKISTELKNTFAKSRFCNVDRFTRNFEETMLSIIK